MDRKFERAKKFLNEYRQCLEEEKQMEDEINRIIAQYGIQSPALTGMPHGQGAERDLSDYAALMEELIDEYRKQIDLCKAKRKEIRNAINALESIMDQRILSFRYIDFMGFVEIAEAVGRDQKYVYTRHTRALEKLVY